ncbi:SMI1/KNR4 family protein [Aneurinibacillus sp. REN35]|uniref:SMI1/KNR4 family protein n=1 Tax=Aneurinibacillus sp. REN35 TaxID=3237286 RepID=UPI00352827D3
MNNNYTIFVEQWNDMLSKICDIGGDVLPLSIDRPATVEEIHAVECKLGFSLPEDFKDVVLHFSKAVYFRWSFPDEVNVPDEWSEVFSGELGWNIEWLEDATPSAIEMEEEGYGQGLKNKLQFFYVGNGDMVAFDMSSEGNNKNIVYWSHEEDEVVLVADSFLSFIEKLTELYCVGAEIWQYETFMDANGLNPAMESSSRWKSWFKLLTEVKREDVAHDLECVIEYVLNHGSVEKEMFELYSRKEIFEKAKGHLQQEDRQRKRTACKIIGEVVGECASDWVLELWKDNYLVDEELRSYLTACCVAEDKGLALVYSYLESQTNAHAARHLCHFQSNKVISWMEEHVRFPVTDGWDELFAVSKPTWDDIVRWIHLEDRHRTTIIHALERMVETNPYFPYGEEQKKIVHAPSKNEVVQLLYKLKEMQVLNNKKRILDEVIEQIDVLL